MMYGNGERYSDSGEYGLVVMKREGMVLVADIMLVG